MTTNNLEEKIEHIVEEGMWTVESQQSNLDYTIPKLLDLFTSYANEVANKAVADFVEWGYGKRCKVKDTEDFPELKHNERCACCEMWEHYDEYIDQLRTKTGEK